jgi:hypothetical protein
MSSLLLYRLDRLRNSTSVWISLAGNLAAFAGLVMLLGIGSSWYMIEFGSPLNVERQGPWTLWSRAAARETDPYTRARFARQGSLPISAGAGATYEARLDEDGKRLHSSCEYAIEGPPPPGNWWSFAVYDDHGLVIPNVADRYSFSSETIAPNPDGGIFISLARDARPGNWLPVGGAGRLVLVLTLVGQRAQAGPASAGQGGRILPAIRRVGCR